MIDVIVDTLFDSGGILVGAVAAVGMGAVAVFPG